MTIKAVSFDLDDTLWPILPVILKAEKDTNEWLLKNYPGVEKLLNSKELMSIRDKLITQKSDLINQLSKLRELSLVELGIRSGYKKEEAKIMARESFKIFFSGRNNVKLYDGVEESLDRLKDKYLLGVITNGNANLEKIGINHYFNFNLSAEDMNTSKPDPKIFEAAVQETGLKAEEVCHVGDHPVNDVQGSLSIGMKAIWFNEKELDWPLDEKLNFKEINFWKELEGALENIN